MKNDQVRMPDWGVLYQQAQKKKNWRRKGQAHWDKKAPSFAERTSRSVYTEKFLALLPLRSDWSVLDIGSGPGTLTLPLASRCRQVTALDFSAGMLEILGQRVGEQGLSNISASQLAWEDDWSAQGISAHDVAIASRSLSVPDLRSALEKLNRFARKMVCVTDKVRHGPFDPDAFIAVGRKLESGPDYIYTVNLLHQMGYLPKVDYIRLDEELRYPSFAEAVAGCGWMFNDLNKKEEQRLEKYVRSITEFRDDGIAVVRRRTVPIWAFISWEPKLIR